MDIANTLIANDDVLSQYAFWKDIFRTLAWWAAKGLKMICDSAEGLYDSAYKLLNFTQYEGIQNFIKSFKPVMIAILIAALLGIGITLMFCTDKIRKYIYNFIIFIGIVSALPYIITSMNKVVLSGKDAVYNGVDNMSQELFAGQVDDLIYISQGGLDSNGKFAMTGNQIDKTKVQYIDINEVIDPDNSQLSSEYQQLFKSQKQINADGSITVDEISEKFLSIFDPPYYYRFHVSWLLLYLSLISLIIAYIFTAYRVVRLVWELIAGQLIAFLASPDITNGQRVLKILETIKNTYIGIFLTCVFIKIYTIAVTYVRSQNFGAFTEVFLIIFFTLALLDGPNMIERIFGVDIGIKPLLAMQASAGVARAGEAAAKNVKNIGQKLYQSATSRADKFSENAAKYAQGFGNVSDSKSGSGNDMDVGEKQNAGKDVNTSAGSEQAEKQSDVASSYQNNTEGNSMSGIENDMDNFAGSNLDSEADAIAADNIASALEAEGNAAADETEAFESNMASFEADSDLQTDEDFASDSGSAFSNDNMDELSNALNTDDASFDQMDGLNGELNRNAERPSDNMDIPENAFDNVRMPSHALENMNHSDSANAGENQLADGYKESSPNIPQVTKNSQNEKDMRNIPAKLEQASNFGRTQNTKSDSEKMSTSHVHVPEKEGIKYSENMVVKENTTKEKNQMLNPARTDEKDVNKDLKHMLDEMRKNQNMILPENPRSKDE